MGSPSALIGTPTSNGFADDSSDLLLFWPGSRFGAALHIYSPARDRTKVARLQFGKERGHLVLRHMRGRYSFDVLDAAHL
jgi:hypothetical protein